MGDKEQQRMGAPIRRELSIQDQATRMPLKKIFIVYFGIGLALIVSFMDQTSVSTAAPVIAADLNGSQSMSWIGTSFFVAKGISGIGGGGINNIAMIIVSDIVPLKERGKYQGLISAATSIGNAIGPFVGGGFSSSQNGMWRWLFRTTCILAVLISVLIHFIIPFKPVTGSAKEKLKKIDYLGVVLSAGMTIMLLVPISGGGSTFEWNSPVVIGLLVAGGVCGLLFILVEWRVARLPILPLRLFTMRTPAVVSVQSFFIGMIYFGNIYELPIYLQYVKGYSSLVSGAFILAGTVPQAIWGVIGGFYISKTNHYKRVIIAGAAIWTLGLGLQLLWKRTTNIGMVIGFLEITSIGIGWSLQTTLVAALATTPSKDRAVVTGGRNFFRTMGGAFGLAMSNAIYQASVTKKLDSITNLTASQREGLLSSSLSYISDLDPSVANDVRSAWSYGLKLVFASFTAIGGMCLIMTFWIQEVEFRKEAVDLEAEKKKQAKASEAGASSEITNVLRKEEKESGDDMSNLDAEKINGSRSSSQTVVTVEVERPGVSDQKAVL
ncbi:hypothetical protein LQV05_005951 [Cryptococcus neoformans]|nr:hypothetical protein LQV05_005951 [Cryptococcus neoformans]